MLKSSLHQLPTKKRWILAPQQMHEALLRYITWRSQRNWPSASKRYGFAILALLLTLAARPFIDPHVPAASPFLLFTLPVLFAAWYGGLSAGILSTLLGLIICDYFFIAPTHTLFIKDGFQTITIIIFIMQGLVISLLIASFHYNQFIAHDSTQRLRDTNEHLRALIDGVSDYAIYMLDPKGYILSWSDAAATITGYREDEVLGRRFSILYLPEELAVQKPERDLQVATRLGRHEEESWVIRKDGTTFWANQVVTALRDEHNTIRGFAKVTRDMTERKRAEDTIKHQAFHDGLTGLPNRLQLQEELLSLIKWAKRNKEMIGILFLDLDRFKSINDTLGHQVGDQLLQQVAIRLAGAVRAEDMVARFGGDEFVITLRNLRQTGDAIKVGQTIIETLRQPYILNDQQLHVNTSIGAAVYPNDGDDVMSLLKNADAALYQAKRAGRDMISLYSHRLNANASERLNLENELRQALDRKQITLEYQPIFSITKGHTVAAEALIRWKHPELGPISPAEFIPLAEESGIILHLGDWVIDTVCEQQASWQKAGFQLVPVAINLSARQFAQSQLSSRIERSLHRSNLDPACITVEVTESVAMHDLSATVAKLTSINRMGVLSAIDDFGIGFSSLNYLKQLPIAKLKIDKSFIEYCTADSRDAAIVKAIISMARSLKLQVVAEGIETKEQLEYLKTTRCDFGQGYLVSASLTASNFERYLQPKK